MSKNKLNIFLAKEGVSIEDAIRDLNPAPNRVVVGNGLFVYKENTDKIPKWVTNFFGDELAEISLANKTIQAAYLLSSEVSPGVTRVFALTFGLGRNLLRLDKFEERFGLITALNLIDSKKLRSVDSNTVASNPKNSKVMLGKLSSINDFEVDGESSLLKSINGKIEENALGDCTTIIGKQSLSLKITVDYSSIEDILPGLYFHFMSDVYREKFPGINHTQEIKDKSLIASLDAVLIENLRTGQNQDVETVVMTIPEIVDDDELYSFKIGNSIDLVQELTINELITYLGNLEDIENNIIVSKLKNENLSIINENGDRTRYWKLYNCLVVDCSFEGHQFVLNEGKWYKYDDNYAIMVQDFYDALPISTIPLSDCGLQEKEGDYNERITTELAKAINWDCELINPFSQTPFEVCDIFDGETMSFIHVKKNTGSSVLSHLVLQGSVSGELFLTPQVRAAAINRKNEMERYISESNYNPQEYKIVYAIIEKGNDCQDRPKIPFFSKVSFRQIIRNLQYYGYQVELKSINWR